MMNEVLASICNPRAFKVASRYAVTLSTEIMTAFSSLRLILVGSNT